MVINLTNRHTKGSKKGGITLQIKLKIYGDINHHLPKGTNLADMSMQPVTILRELISSLRIPQYAIWRVKVNGVEVSFDHHLKDGDTVEIFAPGDPN
ncbi:MAG TPA: hypothetical protein DDZ53_00980 [Firmicutes bacterium]|nr:hypothetical protein [Bacillota bacterium]